MKCLVPRCKCKAEKHHWPIKKADGGEVTVPLCKGHHKMAHRDDPYIISILVEHAPFYWLSIGSWYKAKRNYYRFKEQYLSSIGGKHGPLERSFSNGGTRVQTMG
jgi:hypothetical protein